MFFPSGPITHSGTYSAVQYSGQPQRLLFIHVSYHSQLSQPVSHVYISQTSYTLPIVGTMSTSACIRYITVSQLTYHSIRDGLLHKHFQYIKQTVIGSKQISPISKYQSLESLMTQSHIKNDVFLPDDPL